MKGHDIAIMVGPPGKSSKPPKGDEADPTDPEEAGESADDEEAEVSAMEEFQGALKDGTPEEALKAYKQLRDTCG